MPRFTAGGGVVVALGVQLALATAAPAQDIQWRHDYAAARKEAAATGKPLLIDFGTEACVYCRKLDATTFRDRGIAAAVNERFIPVKVDGNRDAQFTQSAGVESFPTLLVVSADGKIVGRQVGYVDVAGMSALFRKAPPRAVVAAAPVPAPGGVVPASAVVPRSAAGDLLAQARADHAAGRYLACIERCDRLATAHAGSTEAGEARRLSAAITTDPEKWRKVTGQLEADLTAAHRNLDAALGR